jgi:hypothetical protein
LQHYAINDGKTERVKPATLLNAEDTEITITATEDLYKYKELSDYPKGFCVNTKYNV